MNGYGTSPSLTDFDVTSETFTSHSPITSVQNITANGQSYTTIDDTIYMVRTDTIAIFNMATKQFTPTWNNINIPHNHDTSKAFAGCLTNIDDKYLIILGGLQIGTASSDEMCIYDMINNFWISSNLPTMRTPRAIFTCNVHNDYLYAIGWFFFFVFVYHSEEYQWLFCLFACLLW